MNEKPQGRKTFTFITGVLSAAGLIVTFFVPNHVGQLFVCLFVLLPIILVFGFISLLALPGLAGVFLLMISL